jgi:energy-coupling factor transport system ATP-binding protein
MSDDIVVLDNLSFKYPKADAFALRDLNLRVSRGEFVGIVGPTGAGKSTFCLALNGVVPHFYGGEFFGSATVAGLDTVSHPTHELARHIGMVFQDPEMQLTAPTVIAEVAFALENVCTPVPVIRQRISAALEAVRLQGMEDKHPHQLSGGQKQRLAIAAALAMEPEILVLDEPTSQLDPVGADEVFAVVRELNRAHNITIILVSHASEELAEYADRVLLLAEGQFLAAGPPRQFFQHVELLRGHDVRPPEVTSAFRRVLRDGSNGGSTLPVTLPEAVAQFRGMEPRVMLRPVAYEPATNGRAAPTGRRDAEPVLRTSDLRYTYEDGTTALDGVDLTIRKGEYVAIVGQNGAGKSTLVRQFLRLLTATAGQVTAFGRDVDDYSVSELAQRIGYISQNPDNQIFCDTVAREVSFALDKLGFPKDEVKARVGWALEEMKLAWAADEHPLTLSKGDRSRIVIAAILAMKPEVLIFDEPTTGQDYRGARAILDLTRELHAAGRTIVVITHHLYLLPGYAERLVAMGKGRVLLDAPLRDAFYETATLRETFITPPQVIQLAEAIQPVGGPPLRPLTADEFADAIAFR